MPHFSHSQEELHSKCPYAWYLTKIKRVKRAPSRYLIHGRAVHAMLALDGNYWRTTGERMGAGALAMTYLSILHDEMAKDDPDRLIPESDWRELVLDAEAIIAGYVATVQPYYHPDAVEESFANVPIHDSDYTLSGVIDARIWVLGVGWVIVDWKTGKPWQAGKEHGLGQASLYLVADQARGKDAASAVCFVVLSVVDGMCTPAFRYTTRTESDRYAYMEHLRIVTADIDAAIEQDRHDESTENGNAFPRKTSALCAYCDVLAACQSGQNYLRNTNRASHVPGVEL